MYKKKTSCQSCNKLFIPSVKERKKVCTVMDYSMKLNLQGCRLCCDECDVVEVHCLYNECEFKGKVPGWRKVCEVHLSQIEEKSGLCNVCCGSVCNNCLEMSDDSCRSETYVICKICDFEICKRCNNGAISNRIVSSCKDENCGFSVCSELHSSGESSKVFNLKTEPYLLCNHCEEFKPVKTFKLQNEVTCSICRNNGLDSDGCAMCDSCFRKTKSPSIAKKRKRKGANGTKAKEVEGDKKSNNDSESQSELKSANIRKKIKRDETNEPKGEEVVSYNKEDITDDSDFDQSKAEDTTDDVVDFSEEKASSFEEVDGDDIDDEEEEEEEEENEEEEEEEVDSDDREHMEDNRPEDEIEDEEITKYVNEKKRARGEKVYEDGEPGDTLKPLPSCELKISDIIEEVDEKKGTESTHIMVNNPILKIDIGDFEKGTKLNYLEYNTKNKNLLLVKEDGKPQKFQLEIYVKATPINLM